MSENNFVKLGDVAHECRLTWSGGQTDIPIVGLEHLVPGEIELSSWDSNIEHTFSKKFLKGQVLLGRRRVYLKKAVVAPCDGICSGDITVIESTGGILPELLPFVIQNDRFFDYAMQGSAGSLSPRVKWEHLKNYEFSLPPLAEQKVLADKLWAAYRLKESYKKLLATTEEMVKSQFIEMFDFEDERLYTPWGDLFDTQLGKMLDKNKQNPKDISCEYLANVNVQWGYFELSNLNRMTFKEKELAKFALQPNDLLICEGGDAGRCAVWKEENSQIKFQKAIHRARPLKPDIIDVNYVQYYLQYYKKSSRLSDFITKGTIEHLTGEKLNNVPVLVPPISLQLQFATIAHQADKSGFELRKSIEAIDAVIKSLISC